MTSTYTTPACTHVSNMHPQSEYLNVGGVLPSHVHQKAQQAGIRHRVVVAVFQLLHVHFGLVFQALFDRL